MSPFSLSYEDPIRGSWFKIIAWKATPLIFNKNYSKVFGSYCLSYEHSESCNMWRFRIYEEKVSQTQLLTMFALKRPPPQKILIPSLTSIYNYYWLSYQRNLLPLFHWSAIRRNIYEAPKETCLWDNKQKQVTPSYCWDICCIDWQMHAHIHRNAHETVWVEVTDPNPANS